MQRDYPVNLRWAPFLLDPSIPAEGKPRTPQTTAETPRSPIEQAAEARGVAIRRGRTFTPSSRLALEAAEFAYDRGQHSDALHRALFKANFEDFEDIGDIDVVVRIASEQGLEADALRTALADGQYRERVDEQVAWARSAGVRGIPTFIFNYKYAISGAQEYSVFQRMLEQLGYPPPDGDAAHTSRDPDWAI